MAITFEIEDPVGPISVKNFDIGGSIPDNITIREINMVESLLAQSLQTSATLQSAIYDPSGKNFDLFKNQPLTFQLIRKNGSESMIVNQQVYRMDNRDFMPVNVGQTEEFTIHACDKTLMEDTKSLVSRSWKCTTPDKIVSHVLDQCVKASQTKIGSAQPARDYIAENIHPFQVISQQAQVALDGDDPSFLHFMTYDSNSGEGVHHFESLKSMTQGRSIATYNYGETGKLGGGYQNKNVPINFSFPCDFDYLADLLNGVENGRGKNSIATINPVFKLFGMKMDGGGGGSDGCGIGAFNYKVATTNLGTSEQQNSCNIDVEGHLLRRQARMALLEKDKIALRITVPWNPNLHAGKIITLNWPNKIKGGIVYGTGEYLISSLMHTIKFGGFSVTTMDCVSKSVGEGVV